MDEKGLSVWRALAGCLLALFVGLVLGYGLTRDHYQQDAVKRGYAKWVIVNEAGVVKWEWITQK